jgi:sugar lactone lactonase YvrE
MKRYTLILLMQGACFAQGVITTVAGNDAIFADDGKLATSAALVIPNGLAVDAGGNVYIASSVLSMVLKVDTKGVIGVVAGNGLKRYAGDGGPARAASLASPVGVTPDRAGNLFIADTEDCAVRRVDTNGIITTVAGTGPYGFAGDGGPATKAVLSFVNGVAVDFGGNLYISDVQNQRIRKVNSAGIISTIAGNGSFSYTGDGGPAANATVSFPNGVAVDAGGIVYVAMGQGVRKIAPIGTISTVAGSNSGGALVDGGLATAGSLNGAYAVTVDSIGNLYITEQGSQRVRRVSPQSIIITIAGNGKSACTGDGGSATVAALSSPSGAGVDAI